MNRLSLIATLLIALLVSVGSTACATPKQTKPTPQKTERSQITALLSAIHELPSKAQFEQAAENPVLHLKAIATDATVFKAHRYAAFAALGYWPDEATRALYVAAIAPEQEEGLRHRTIRLLATHYGAEAVPHLVVIAVDPDVQIRLTVATALNDVPGPEARKALAEMQAREQSPLVQEKIAEFMKMRDSIR